MKYTKQELIWLLNLVEKSVIESSKNMKCNNPAIKALAELRRDNMQDLCDKIRKDIEQQKRNGRIGR